MRVTGKHKEILIEVLSHYVISNGFLGQKMVIDIKAQNEEGQRCINYYINDYRNGVPQHEPQNNNPEHTNEENNDSNG